MKSNPMMKPKANKKCTKPILNTVWVGCFINTNKDNKALQKTSKARFTPALLVFCCYTNYI